MRLYRTCGQVTDVPHWLAAWSSGREDLAGASVGYGLPDQLGHIHDQIRPGLSWIDRCAHFADADGDRIVEPGIRLTVGQVKHR